MARAVHRHRDRRPSLFRLQRTQGAWISQGCHTSRKLEVDSAEVTFFSIDVRSQQRGSWPVCQQQRGLGRPAWCRRLGASHTEQHYFAIVLATICTTRRTISPHGMAGPSSLARSAIPQPTRDVADSLGTPCAFLCSRHDAFDRLAENPECLSVSCRRRSEQKCLNCRGRR